MARLAVFASGNGSNFQVIAEAVQKTDHQLAFLLCNSPEAFAITRAKNLNVPVYLVSYRNRERETVEAEILAHCETHHIQLIALAGFMKLVTPWFLSRFTGKILNLHPSLLPKHPGVDAIRRSYEAQDPEIGISIIAIDEGCDTGPILFQQALPRVMADSLETVEAKIHALEHEHYPRVVIEALAAIETER